MARYALTIFVSAFLLFQVQPLIARYVLPWFGGGPAIWTTCMLFFQTMLLGGYLYAHLLSVKLKVSRQAWVHAGLLLASLVLLPIAPSPRFKPDGTEEPVMAIVLLLLATVGGPYLLLSSTGPLMQRWFSRSFPGRSPYRLYSLSNIGSMLALISYPFFFEPRLRLSSQVWLWTGAYAVFVGLACWCAWLLRDVVDEPQAAVDSDLADADDPPPSWGRTLLWLGLSSAGSAMLLATTNQMCIDVAVVPFLWVLPLALYLLSFVICFDNPRWYDRRVFGSFLVVAASLACWQMSRGLDTSIPGLVALYCFVMFACCMTCHGELVALRPGPRHLTWFYLMVSLGGAVGGLFVAVGAPMWFLGFWEYQAALGAACAMTVIAWLVGRVWQTERQIGLAVWTVAAALQAYFVYQFVFKQLTVTPPSSASVWLFLGTGVLQMIGLVGMARNETDRVNSGIVAGAVTVLQIAWVALFLNGWFGGETEVPSVDALAATEVAEVQGDGVEAGEVEPRITIKSFVVNPGKLPKFWFGCLGAGVIGWFLVWATGLIPAANRSSLSADVVELTAVAGLIFMWAMDIGPVGARVAAMTGYLLTMIVLGLSKRIAFLSTCILSVALLGLEWIGFLSDWAASGFPEFIDADGLLANRITNSFPAVEFPMSLLMRGLGLGAIWLLRSIQRTIDAAKSKDSKTERGADPGIWLMAPAIGACAMLIVSLNKLADRNDDAMHLSRNFYGVLMVDEYGSSSDKLGKYLSLTHGQIEHGNQFISEEFRNQPTTYYGYGTGVELALRVHPRRFADDRQQRSLRVGVIGLGTGTVIANGKKGDHFRFYEINSDVVSLSKSDKPLFTYLRDANATHEIVLGDARVMMEREAEEGSQQYDVMVVDAFSSDAIPVHLLTQECGKLYKKHLKRDGLLCIHISNRYLDLNPITRGLANDLGWNAIRIESNDDEDTGVYASSWIIVTANEQFAALREVKDNNWGWAEDSLEPILWTDDFASLYPIIAAD